MLNTFLRGVLTFLLLTGFIMSLCICTHKGNPTNAPAAIYAADVLPEQNSLIR